MKILIIGLTVTSSRGNGQETTYRSLIKGLYRRGHQVLFLERDVPLYRENRDMVRSKFFNTGFYSSFEDLKSLYNEEIKNADLVIIGSCIEDGPSIAEWVQKESLGIKAFYDMDTPVTLAGLENGTCNYIRPENIPAFDIYLSFSAGKSLNILSEVYGAKNPVQFFCSVDPELYYPLETKQKWDMGYLGTYSGYHQPQLEKLMLNAARDWNKGKFVVSGSQYPETIKWPANVERVDHPAPEDQTSFYCQQRYTLNITREEMIKAGYSPSVRLFEAAACGVAVISDYWTGLSSIFEPGEEIFISRSSFETLEIIRNTPEEMRLTIGENARMKILKYHTGDHRARELEQYFFTIKNREKLAVTH